MPALKLERLATDKYRSQHVDRVGQDHDYDDRLGEVLFDLPQPTRSPLPLLREFLNLREGLSKRSEGTMNRGQHGPLFCFAQRLRCDTLGLELRRDPPVA